MKKLLVRLPEDLARSLKIRAAAEDTTMAAIVARAVQRELERGDKRKAPRRTRRAMVDRKEHCAARPRGSHRTGAAWPIGDERSSLRPPQGRLRWPFYSNPQEDA